MTLYDSSALIDFLDGNDTVVDYVATHLDAGAVAPPLVLFEVYQGEVYKAGPADFDAVDDALRWLTVVDVNAAVARTAAEVQKHLQQQGSPLAARDAFIAGAAKVFDERLVVTDADFDVPGLVEVVEVDVR